MSNKMFWTLRPDGTEVLRDLKKENESFTFEKYKLGGEFDANNFQWHELFNHYIYDDNGCDYERYGCFIKEGDVVLDLGGNIGVFAHRAELRGASKVFSFEPITPTFNCLLKNAGPKTTVYKNAIGGENKFVNFKVHTDFAHIGGGTSDSQDLLLSNKHVVYSEKSYMININDIFEGLGTNIDFMKIDIEGGEVDVLTKIKDEHLMSLRCLAAEFHKTYDEFEVFQNEFLSRMTGLGFKTFTLYHGDGNLRTINCWKE